MSGRLAPLLALCLLLGAAACPAPEPIDFTAHEESVFSQFGEDGVIQALFERIEPTTKYAVEFGASDGVYLSNTRNLFENFGWSGLLIEASNNWIPRLEANYADLPRVKTLHAWVFPGNVEILFEEAGVPEDLDLLVIDIDSNDYYVWRAIHDFRPKVVLIEINPYFPPPQRMVIDFHPMTFWDGTTDYFGASIVSMIELGRKKGYEPVHNTGGFNLFFVDRKYYSRFGIEDNSPEALYRKWLPGADRWNRDPEGRGEVPFREPYIDIGSLRIRKKFLFHR